MSVALLRSILEAFPGKRILVVGDVMLDEYIWGDVHRISPEAPVPVVDVKRRTYVPGGAANTAANVAALGGDALLGGVVGCDHAAGQLREVLAQNEIPSTGLMIDAERATTVKTRVLAHNHQVLRLDQEQRGALPRDVEQAIDRWITEQIPHVSACVLSDYAKGVVTSGVAESLIAAARRANLPIVVDPKNGDYARFRGATVIKPNLREAEQIAQREIQDDVAFREAGERLTRIFAGSAVLITRGAQGMTLFRDGLPALDIPSVARSVYDVTGAGDTVGSALAMSLAAGATLEEAAHLANRAAAVAVAKLGTSSVKLDELRAALQ